MAKPTQTSRLVIAGAPVEVSHEVVPLDALQLDPQNPRIRLQLKVKGSKKAPTQEGLLELIRAQPGYDRLQQQIRMEGGIYDPLIVRNDGRIVEGNTRFAVLTVLSKTPAGVQKWGSVPIMRLPVGVSEKVIQLQMAGYHVGGKNKWRAAAKADQIHRLIHEVGASLEEVQAATGMAPKEVQKHIDAYDYLVKEVIPEIANASAERTQEILETKFSHALVLMSTSKLDGVRQDKGKRKALAQAIANDKIQGAQVRQAHLLLNEPRARTELQRNGFAAAKEVLRKADPCAESKVLKDVTKLADTLGNLGRKDLELFADHAKARDALQALVTAAETVLAMAKREKKRGD
ncbi:MAG: hypothetical protein BGO74_03900 [Burkholderiales bacterium 68-12]|nr:MAG: hypothetical protein BGO74_03900 [Burkholderiales bacterium 68-12]